LMKHLKRRKPRVRRCGNHQAVTHSLMETGTGNREIVFGSHSGSIISRSMGLSHSWYNGVSI
jgi:hypothetical protein